MEYALEYAKEEENNSCYPKLSTYNERKMKKKEIEANLALARDQRRGFDMNEMEAKMESLGVGALPKQFNDTIFTLVASRYLPLDFLREIDLKHIKGLILHGPHGTGKTLIAQSLSKILNAKLQIVKGPEIISGEKNLRDTFAPAIKDFEDMGDKSPLHVIILDELDFIAKRRRLDLIGRTVNELCTMMDGFTPLNNLLLLGTTNRIDDIDEALLRPGRFELCLQIDLPDENGRLQILKIHSKRMLFSTDIDLSTIASMTQGLSGADIKKLLRMASCFAVSKTKVFSSIKKEDFIIKKVDIEKALHVGFGKISSEEVGEGCESVNFLDSENV